MKSGDTILFLHLKSNIYVSVFKLYYYTPSFRLSIIVPHVIQKIQKIQSNVFVSIEFISAIKNSGCCLKIQKVPLIQPVVVDERL